MASILDFLTNPLTLGAGLTATGALLDREPGEVLEARQALRNQFNAPYESLLPGFSRTGTNYLESTVKAPADPFAPGGVYSQYLPALQRSEEDVLGGLQTRYNAAFPASMGIQGSAVEALRRAAGELATNRQTLQADIFRQQQGQQQNAANALLQYGLEFPRLQQNAAAKVLEFSRPDPTAQAIANLGTILAMSGRGGTAGATSASAGIPGLDALLQSLGGTTRAGASGAGAIPATLSNIGQLITQAGGPANWLASPQAQQLAASLNTVFSLDATQAGAGLSGVMAQTSHGVSVPLEAIAATGADFGLAGPGLLGAPSLSSLSGVASGLGAAGAGFALGNTIGQRVQTPTSTGETVKSGAGGAAVGAAAGFALGGPLGAAIGGIAGLTGGIFGQHRESVAIKAQRHAADQESHKNNTGVLGSFWTNALGAAGGDVDSFNGFVQEQLAIVDQGWTPFSFGGISGTLDQGDAIARVGSQLLLREIQKTNPQITDLDQVPNFRKGYIDYLMESLRVEAGGGLRKVSGIPEFGSFLTSAEIAT